MRVNSFCTPRLEGWLWQIWARRARLRRADTLLRFGLASWRWSGSPHSDPKVRNDLEELEAAGLLGRFRSNHLRDRWWGMDRPRAPQTVVGGGCAAWAPLPPEGSFLGSDCSLDKEEEGVEWSLVLLGMNCLRAADCVLVEWNFSTTELTASPNNPDCEMGESSKNTFSFYATNGVLRPLNPP